MAAARPISPCLLRRYREASNSSPKAETTGARSASTARSRSASTSGSSLRRRCGPMRRQRSAPTFAAVVPQGGRRAQSLGLWLLEVVIVEDREYSTTAGSVRFFRRTARRQLRPASQLCVRAAGTRSGVVNSTQAGNEQLKPERASELELGADLEVLGGRAGVELTYFNKKVSDLILPERCRPTTGFLTQLANVGEAARTTDSSTAVRLFILRDAANQLEHELNADRPTTQGDEAEHRAARSSSRELQHHPRRHFRATAARQATSSVRHTTATLRARSSPPPACRSRTHRERSPASPRTSRV